MANRAPSASVEEEEPRYGATYLPRKFKIAFTYPGDNCVDAYTQDGLPERLPATL